MININSKSLEIKEAVGFKVVVKHIKSGTYRSTMTGTIIKKGKVIKPNKDKKVNVLSFYWNYSLLQESFDTSPFFNSHVYGKTILFKNINDADFIFKKMNKFSYNTNYKLILVQITLSGNIYSGNWDNIACYFSSYIKSIKEI